MNDYSGLTADNLYQTLQKEKGREKELFESTVDTNIQSTCRVVRIFISSTFRDFYWERDVLVKTVFPKLRIWCEERNIFLLECDLRWGVPKEATGQEAVLTCLEEIEKCREEMNGRNFFLGLIGHRYGWCPGDEELNDFIKNRYSWIGGASMTLMEIILGAIRTMTPNALFMLREADFLDNMDSKMREEFYECEEMTAKKMEKIRKFLCDVFSEKNQTHRYTCKYEETIEDSLTSEKRAKLAKLDDFGDKVYLFFKRAIENQFACELKNDFDTKKNEMDQQNALLNTLTRNAHGRSDILKSMLHKLQHTKYQSNTKEDPLHKYAAFNNGNKIICLTGPPGMGKSTLLACLIGKLQASPDINLFYHFCGASASSKSEEFLKNRIIDFLRSNQQDSETRLYELLRKIDHATVIIVDALDEITHDCEERLGWLPCNTPKYVHVVVSCLEGGATISDTIEERDAEVIRMKPLHQDTCKIIVEKFFLDYGKKLDKQQMQSLIDHRSSSNPLWLTQACEELRIHGSFLSLTKAILNLPHDLNGLNRKILSRLIREDSSTFIRIFLQVLYISRVGVWENNIKKVLASLKSDVGNNEEICQTVWNEVIRPLTPFVAREYNPIPIIKFRHRIVKAVIYEELFYSKEEIKHLHSSLAEFYSTCENSNYTNVEYAYHLYYAYRWRELVTFLRSKRSTVVKGFTRKKLMKSMTCRGSIHSKHIHPKLCDTCTHSLCIRPNTDYCFLCNEPHFKHSVAHFCRMHMQRKFEDHCMGCDKPSPSNPILLCKNCSHGCSQIVDETTPDFEVTKKRLTSTNIIPF